MKKQMKEMKNDNECCEDCSDCGDCKSCCNKKWQSRSKCGGVYGLGFLGAAIYYVSTASTFWAGVLGILKAAVWPAFVIFKLLGFLGA